MREATTSISPVGRFGFTGRGTAQRHFAFDRDHVLRAHLLGAAVHSGSDVLMKYDLGDAIAVAQIDEDDASMIAPAVHPAHQDHGLAFIGGAQRSAVMRAAQVAQKIQCYGSFHIDVQFRAARA